MHHQRLLIRIFLLLLLVIWPSAVHRNAVMVFASEEGVIVPAATTLPANTSDNALSDDFDVTGIENIMVFVTLPPAGGSRISINTTTGLTLIAESSGWTNQSSIRFWGSVADVNAALDSLTISTQAAGMTMLTVTVTAYDGMHFYLPSTGHFYREISSYRISFFDAMGDASMMTYKGRPGYVATISSGTEYDFTKSLIYSTNDVWIALSDEDNEDTWKWKNGPESGMTTSYTHWCDGQPNGNWLIDQDYVQFSGSAGGSCWTDVIAHNLDIDGYLIEYGDMTPFSEFVSASMMITVANPTATPSHTATSTATETATNTATLTVTDTPTTTTTPTVIPPLIPSATPTSIPVQYLTHTATRIPVASQVATLTIPVTITSAPPQTATLVQPTSPLTSRDNATQLIVATTSATPIQLTTTILTATDVTQPSTATALPLTPTLTETAIVSDGIVLSPTITNTTTVVSNTTTVDGALNALQRNTLSATQALTLATNAQVLQQATGAQATQIFATLETSTLDPATQQAIIDAVQTAPDEVRAAFEANINLFGDGFNSYIPLGSQIPISTRRAMIAAGVAVAAVASGATRGRSRSR